MFHNLVYEKGHHCKWDTDYHSFLLLGIESWCRTILCARYSLYACFLKKTTTMIFFRTTYLLELSDEPIAVFAPSGDYKLTNKRHKYCDGEYWWYDYHLKPNQGFSKPTSSYCYFLCFHLSVLDLVKYLFAYWCLLLFHKRQSSWKNICQGYYPSE